MGEVHPIPNSFPQEKEASEFSYVFLSTKKDATEATDPKTRWTTGKSIDGKGKFSFRIAKPHGQEPELGMAKVPEVHAQLQQMDGQ